MSRHAVSPAKFRGNPAHNSAIWRGPTGREESRFTRTQAVAMLTGLAVLVAAIAVAAALVTPTRARAFDLFHGSIYLGDDRAPVAVDLTNGKPTVRLINAYAQVSAGSETNLDVVPLSAGTLLMNKTTGEFNVVDTAGFVVKTTGGGVPLPSLEGGQGTQAVASGSSAYIVQSAPNSTAVYLVGPSTVEAARSVSAKVRPRALAKLAQGSRNTAGAAAAANGDLWLLGTGAAGNTVHQFSVPANSDNGVDLDDVTHGVAGRVAALGVATDDASADVNAPRETVAVASSTSITVYSPTSTAGQYSSHTSAVSGLANADRILAATNGVGRLSFLYHSSGGWTLVVTPTAGDDSGRGATQKNLSGITASANLAPPTSNDGKLFTLDRSNSGTLWSIDLSTAETGTFEGLKSYPILSGASGKALESADFDDVYLLSRGHRVVINSPNHRMAIIIFTDDSSGPLGIDKSTAVDLNASGGAAAVADTRTEQQKQEQQAKQAQQTPDPNPPSPTPALAPPAPQVNNEASCATSNQIPHIPTITTVTSASRSVMLAWNYPLLDTQDCAPSTYAVQVQLVGGSAPPPPGPITVQGQSGVNLAGLYPNSRYQVVVTAYINGRGTASEPIPFTTGREGPVAPNGVHTTTDSAGNWLVSWTACGSSTPTCVPAASWTVTPAYCDGVGLSGPLTPTVITGDPTLTQFTASFTGPAETLGRGLGFQVQGIGLEGDVGAAAGDGACSYSWSPPNPALFGLAASAPGAPSTFGQSVTATINLTITGDPVHAVGGIGVQYTFALLLDNKVITSQVTAQTSVNFNGLMTGKQYQTQVTVTPQRHPEKAFVVGPIALNVATASWPTLSAAASFAVTAADPINGTLTLTFGGGLSSASTAGERFILAGGSLVCGNSQFSLSAKEAFDPATPLTFAVNRFSYHGSCQATGLQLLESGAGSNSQPLFGGTLSAPFTSSTVSIDVANHTPGANDFTAHFDPAAANVIIEYHGGDPTYAAYLNWTFTVAKGTTQCGTTSTPNSSPSFQVKLSNTAECQELAGGGTSEWNVTVTYLYFGASTTATVAVTGNPPRQLATPVPATPTPVVTPRPTATPTPIVTPRPTVTPMPSATPLPTPK